MIIILKNNFHNVETSLRVKNGSLSVGQVLKARKELCGIKSCCCGDDLGRRGPQENKIEVTFDNRTGKITGAIVYER
jgi:hypothetical protein